MCFAQERARWAATHTILRPQAIITTIEETSGLDSLEEAEREPAFIWAFNMGDHLTFSGSRSFWLDGDESALVATSATTASCLAVCFLAKQMGSIRASYFLAQAP